MLQGIQFKANPTPEQKLILSQWMGCARMIWNAKCDEHTYYATYAKKYCPIGTFAPVGQKTAQFKSKEFTPNKAILNVGWHALGALTQYKADKVGKAVFKVSAAYMSQECAHCGHIHPDNRKTQAQFECGYCGHIDSADNNASLALKQRAINLILDSGTELAGKGIPLLVSGRGANRKPEKGTSLSANGREASKKKRLAAASVSA